MAITRLEMNYYKNIERIAVALETLVIEAKTQKTDHKLDRFKKASNLIYGNDSQGRSSDNYQYPSKTSTRTSPGNFRPNIHNELDERIYQESQGVTGGEFQDWYHALTPDEIESYRRVYGH